MNNISKDVYPELVHGFSQMIEIHAQVPELQPAECREPTDLNEVLFITFKGSNTV